MTQILSVPVSSSQQFPVRCTSSPLGVAASSVSVIPQINGSNNMNQPSDVADAAEAQTDNLSVIPEAAKGSRYNLPVITEETASGSTVVEDVSSRAEPAEEMELHAFQLTVPNISREEMERIKRRLTLAPGRANLEAFHGQLSSMDNFCRKSQEAVNMGLDESSVGLLNRSNQPEQRKSLDNFLPSSQGVPSPSSGISWRDELKTLKEELALPASVSLRISGMEKTCDNKADSGSQQDVVPALDLVVKPPTPPPGEMFLKDKDFDYLSKFGSGRIDSNLARQSVYIHFDPVVEKALKEPKPSEDKRNESSGKSTRPTKEVSEEESVLRISAVQKQISINRKRDLKELDDLIEKLTLEIEEQENKSETPAPEVLSTSEQTELLMKLDVEIARLRAELTEQPPDIHQLLNEIDECDKVIVQLTEDKEKFEANNAKLLEEKIQDNSSHKEHLEYMEEMFNNLYQNYLKAKESRKGLIHNKTVLEKHNQLLTEVDNKFKEDLGKIKAEHERTIMNAKRELASKELEIRKLKKQEALKI